MNAQTNMRSTRDIDEMSIDDLAAMDIEEMKILFDAVVDENLSSITRKKKMQSAFHKKTGAPLIGSKRVDGVKVSTTKTVKWAGLDKLYDQIKAEGGNPDVYIQRVESFKVKEAAYAAWPDDIRARFTPLRTVTPGSVKVEFYDVL